MIKCRIYLAKSPIDGVGVFAAEDIPRGAPVWEFNLQVDLVYTPEQWRSLVASIDPVSFEQLKFRGCKENGKYYLSVDGAQYMNHSTMRCNTCFDRAANRLLAARDICRGEELLCNHYDFCDAEDVNLEQFKQVLAVDAAACDAAFVNSFADFHNSFSGDINSLRYDEICGKCSNNCETSEDNSLYVIALLPHEAEYLAAKLGMSAHAFRNEHLFGVQFGELLLDLFRITRCCTFFDPATYNCLLGEHKIIACKIYPLIHGYQSNFMLCRKCALVDHERARRYYASALPVYRKLLDALNVSQQFTDAVAFFDQFRLSPEFSMFLNSSQEYQVFDYQAIKPYLLSDSVILL